MAKKLTTDPEELEKEGDQRASGESGADAKEGRDSDARQEGDEERQLEKENAELARENEELKRRLEEHQNAAAHTDSGGKRQKKEKKVKIRIPIDHRHKDDLTVGLNGTLYRMQRGKEVEVPEGVAEIINRSIEQDMQTEEMISRLVAEAAKDGRG